MKRTVLIFASLIVALLCLFQLSKYSYSSGDTSIEIIIAVIAIVFFFIGVYINQRSSKKRITRDNEEVDQGKIEELGLSKREYEVLVQVSKGLSNKEIANTLFVSESTIKTHVSNLLIKLDAKRRTQAIRRAKILRILPE
ncbi:MAG: response regulator transcription factor [Flavobacteriaceae bacterium]